MIPWNDQLSLFNPKGAANEFASLHPLFVFDPGTVAVQSSLLTVAGGFITAARDAAGGAVVLNAANTARYGTSSPRNGRAYLARRAADTYATLMATSGGLTGDVPHSIVVCVRLAGTPSPTQFSIAQFGKLAEYNSLIGTISSGSWWGGGNAYGAPTTPLVIDPLLSGGATATPFVAVAMKTYDGTNTRIYIDGQLMVSQTGITTPFQTAELGFGRFSNSYYAGDVDIFGAMWFNRALNFADRQAIQTYYNTLISIEPTRAQIVYEGDSLTYGTGSTGGNDYPSQVTAGLGQTTIKKNLGVPGSVTANALARTARTDDIYSARHNKNLYVLTIGTNNVTNGTSSAAIIADIQTLASGRKTTGRKVVLTTIPPMVGLTAPKEAVRVAVNAWITGSAVSGGYADSVVDLGPVEATLLTQTTDGTHFSNAGYTTWAGVATPIINALL